MPVVHLFGKEGCTKCAAMKRRLTALLERPEFAAFRIEYHDVMTLPGIVEFCKAGCLNPNRIPAVLVSGEDGKYLPGRIRRRTDEGVFAESVTFPFAGIQTDYDHGGGVVSPAALEDVLRQALEASK